jgi:hypothetical protein
MPMAISAAQLGFSLGQRWFNYQPALKQLEQGCRTVPKIGDQYFNGIEIANHSQHLNGAKFSPEVCNWIPEYQAASHRNARKIRNNVLSWAGLYAGFCTLVNRANVAKRRALRLYGR